MRAGVGRQQVYTPTAHASGPTGQSRRKYVTEDSHGKEVTEKTRKQNA